MVTAPTIQRAQLVIVASCVWVLGLHLLNHNLRGRVAPKLICSFVGHDWRFADEDWVVRCKACGITQNIEQQLMPVSWDRDGRERAWITPGGTVLMRREPFPCTCKMLGASDTALGQPDEKIYWQSACPVHGDDE